MVHLSTPWILFALPAVLLLVWLLRRTTETQSRLRRAASFLARTAGFAALLLAMSGPMISRATPRAPLVVYALDVSESVDDAALEDALDAIAHTPRGSLAGVVAFAGRADVLRAAEPGPVSVAALRDRVLVRRRLAELRVAAETDANAPKEIERLAAWRASIDPLHTDIAAAVTACQVLYRADCENRTIVMTDGRCDALPADPRVRYVRLPAPRRKDFIVRAVHAPTAVRYGEPFDVQVEVESSYEGDWSLALTTDDQPSRVEKFHMQRGRATVALRNLQKEKALDPGLHRLRINATASGDEETRNNIAYGSVTVVGRPRVLLVDGAAHEGDAAEQMLTLQAIGFERVAAEKLWAWREELPHFTAVVLAGVAPGSLTPTDLEALRTYLANGGGLLFVGSQRLEAEKSLARPEFSAFLPVEFLPAKEAPPSKEPGPKRTNPTPSTQAPEMKKVLAPSVALCLLIDRSGSMAGTPLSLAKEACLAAAKTLTDKDFIAVIPFDAVVDPRAVIGFTPANQVKELEEKILRITAAGGTKIHAGLEAALKLYTLDSRVSGAIKHCILLSDGMTMASDLAPILKDLNDFHVTVSTICIGASEDFDFNLMHSIASACGGRARFSDKYERVPQLFVEEARQVITKTDRQPPTDTPAIKPPEVKPPVDPPPDVKPVPARRAIEVVVKDEHEVLRGVVRDFKPLTGALAARARAGAVVPLASKDGDPLLAVWRFDLGKAAVWCADLGGPWSEGWSENASTTKLFAQVIRHLSSAAEDLDLARRVRIDRDLLRIERAAPTDAFDVQVLGVRRRLELMPADGGALVARLPLGRPGEAVDVAISRPRADGTSETVTISAASPYERELASIGDAPCRFDEVESRPLAEISRQLPLPAGAEEQTGIAIWCVLAALILLPIDIALRRIQL